MDEYYDQIAEGYEELHKEEQELKIAFIKERLDEYYEIKSDDKLLDVGCGTGITTIPWPCERTGLDPAKKLLKRAHDKKNVKYVQARAEKIPFENNNFDIITSITAIQNFKDVKKGLNEIKRVGKQFFILTYLKKSAKSKNIERLMKNLFDVKARFEEDKDVIFFCIK